MSRVVVVLAGLVAGCDRPAEPPRPDPLARGVAYLVGRQAADGAWRSDVYATFRDGTALTPPVVVALHDAGVPGAEPAVARGLAFLAGFVADGSVRPPADGFDYPVYTAALAVRAWTRSGDPDAPRHVAAWVAFLKERQLTERLGWRPDEPHYGGWGYCRVVPRKPRPGAFAPSLIESNLSATAFALDALRAAGGTDPAVYQAAAVFVRRRQSDADGGFHFVPADPVRNKAGAGDGGFHSYGSATADGLRALAACGDPADAGRREAAAGWLRANLRADEHPGRYAAAREANREAVYFYFAAAAARAVRDHPAARPAGRDWAGELTAALSARQAADGSWANPLSLVREDDPLVATPAAVSALALGR